MKIARNYLEQTVLEAARTRTRFIFDTFARVYVSISGGKDSTVLYHLCLEEAVRREQKLYVFFLDQEAEYAATVELMRGMMAHPAVIPLWHQVPLFMTNATSYAHDQLYAWGEGEPWMREKEPGAIHAIEGDYPRRFYPFFEWFEKEQPEGSAFLVGLRAEESIHRFSAVTKHAGLPGVPWSSKTKRKGSFKCYPIYDFGMGDVWKYIADHGVSYNAIYDRMWALNKGVYRSMRVSNLVHEQSFRSLVDLPMLEPETYARLERRLRGVHAAAHHGESPFFYDAQILPGAFPFWRAYRDHLLATMPVDEAKRARFAKRFATMPEGEATFQAQCKRLLINDHENNVPIPRLSAAREPGDKFARWRKLW